MNVYLPEFGLWRPPLLLAGRLWTPAGKEQESHLYIHEEQVMFYLIFICFPQKKNKVMRFAMTWAWVNYIHWTNPLRMKNTRLPNVIIRAPLGGEISSYSALAGSHSPVNMYQSLWTQHMSPLWGSTMSLLNFHIPHFIKSGNISHIQLWLSLYPPLGCRQYAYNQ